VEEVVVGVYCSRERVGLAFLNPLNFHLWEKRYSISMNMPTHGN
jgi:hypothetical protein